MTGTGLCPVSSGREPARGSCVPSCQNGPQGPWPACKVGCGRRNLEGEFRRGLWRRTRGPQLSRGAGSSPRWLALPPGSCANRKRALSLPTALQPGCRAARPRLLQSLPAGGRGPQSPETGAGSQRSPGACGSVCAALSLHTRPQGGGSPVLQPLLSAPCSLPQGVDQNAKPLIIGPEEDYDPGCLNSEVTVPAFLFSSFFGGTSCSRLEAAWLAAAGGSVGRKPWSGNPGGRQHGHEAGAGRAPGPRL